MVLAVVDDLLFSSRIRSVAGAAGRPVTFVRRPDAVLSALREHAPDLILLDLDREALDPIGTIRAIRAAVGITQPRIVGFGSHVHVERLQDAKTAGCDQAMARSGFVAALPSMMAGVSSAAESGTGAGGE
jgi:CheY-like chemotaxis protein